MFAKLGNLLAPLKNFQHKATLIKIGLASVVLGVGGYAVYKGAQQMKPKRPTPKPTITAANKLKGQQSAVVQAGGAAPLQVVSGQVGEDTSAASLYADGIEQNPAEAQQNQNLYQADASGTTDQHTGGAYSSVPPSPLSDQTAYNGYQDAAPIVDGSSSADESVPENRIRSLPTSAGSYRTADEMAAPAAGDQPAALADENAYGGSAMDNEYTNSQSQGIGGAAADVNSVNVITEDTLPANVASDGTAADTYSDSTAYDSTGAATVDDSTGSGRAPQKLPPIGGDELAGVSGPVMTGGALRSSPGGRITQPAVSSQAASGTPGDRQLEGTQVPSIAIEKFAPAEIQVGKPATLEIRVRNSGQTAAHDVLVTDQVPRGTRLESTSPEAQVAADGSIAWQLGEMQPGDEVVFSMQVLPEQEGEIGSVAHVVFSGRATARSVCTRPLLAIEHTAPKQVLIGETISLAITVHNPGTGAATGVIVEEDVPPGLAHVAGSELEYEVGTLRPGESRQLQLQLTADKPGLIENVVTVRGEGNLIAQHQVQIEVIAPQLQVQVTGPKIRYLDRQATYTLAIANPGTAAARSVELVAYLPKGMKFQSTDAEGQYDATQHAVFWSLEELPANKSGSVNLVAVPVETGEQRLRIEGRADLGLSATSEQAVQVEARSELEFDIVDVNDPIEVGTETIYEIRIINKGTRPATAVEVAAGLPPAIKPVSAEGHSRGEVQGQQVLFEPVGRINPGEEVKFRIHAQGAAEGDHVIAVQVRSAEFQTPVTREESTRVYVDR